MISDNPNIAMAATVFIWDYFGDITKITAGFKVCFEEMVPANNEALLRSAST